MPRLWKNVSVSTFLGMLVGLNNFLDSSMKFFFFRVRFFALQWPLSFKYFQIMFVQNLSTMVEGMLSCTPRLNFHWKCLTNRFFVEDQKRFCPLMKTNICILYRTQAVWFWNLKWLDNIACQEGCAHTRACVCVHAFRCLFSIEPSHDANLQVHLFFFFLVLLPNNPLWLTSCSCQLDKAKIVQHTTRVRWMVHVCSTRSSKEVHVDVKRDCTERFVRKVNLHFGVPAASFEHAHRHIVLLSLDWHDD